MRLQPHHRQIPKICADVIGNDVASAQSLDKTPHRSQQGFCLLGFRIADDHGLPATTDRGGGRTTLALPPIQHYVTTMLLHSTPTVRRPAASTLCPPTLSHSVPDDRRNAGQTRRCMRSAKLPETQLSCVDADAYPKFVACEAKRLDKLPASGTAASLDLARREHCPSGVVALRTREIEDSHIGVANGLVQEGPPMPTWRSWPTKLLRQHMLAVKDVVFRHTASAAYRFADSLDQLT
jgi:hypothetical protein